jgi:hypothetical protein
MNRKTFLKALVLGLAFAATATVPLRAEDRKQPAGSFAGLVKDSSVARLVKPIDTSAARSTYTMSVISDAKAFQTFINAAGLKKAPFDVDWDRQALVVVVLKEHTYWLDYKQWTAKDGVGELVFTWDGIEPDYHDQFPAVMHRFDKAGLKKVVVKLDGADKVLGEVPCP